MKRCERSQFGSKSPEKIYNIFSLPFLLKFHMKLDKYMYVIIPVDSYHVTFEVSPELFVLVFPWVSV